MVPEAAAAAAAASALACASAAFAALVGRPSFFFGGKGAALGASLVSAETMDPCACALDAGISMACERLAFSAAASAIGCAALDGRPSFFFGGAGATGATSETTGAASVEDVGTRAAGMVSVSAAVVGLQAFVPRAFFAGEARASKAFGASSADAGVALVAPSCDASSDGAAVSASALAFLDGRPRGLLVTVDFAAFVGPITVLSDCVDAACPLSSGGLTAVSVDSVAEAAGVATLSPDAASMDATVCCEGAIGVSASAAADVQVEFFFGRPRFGVSAETDP